MSSAWSRYNLNLQQPMNTKSRILIVDDEPQYLAVLAAKLSDEYEIIQSYNGQDALEKAETGWPDLIMVDILMPELDGYEVTRRLKANRKTHEIPVILMTVLDEKEERIKGLAAGADEFLSKPVDTTELLARVKSLIALKHYGEQLQARLQSEQFFSALVAEEATPQKKTLLLIEDDDVCAHLIINYLKEGAYNIELFTDGAEAINHAASSSVDLILLDIMLPGIDGFEVCRRLGKIAQIKHIPIVIITCLKDIESRIRGIKLGADDFLIKPVNREILIARVTALLKKKEYFDRLSSDYERALHSAITDKLTGLYNHTYFKQFLRLEIERSRRQQHPLSLMMLDIDDFKQYNDMFGHLAGDDILQTFGEVIHQHIRKIDLPARYGGEEFAIVLPYTEQEGTRIVAERLRKAIASHFATVRPSGTVKRLTVSIGIAGFQSNIATVDELIDRSDKALYQAKRAGKNRVCVFE